MGHVYPEYHHLIYENTTNQFKTPEDNLHLLQEESPRQLGKACGWRGFGDSSGLLRMARGGYCNQAFASGYSSVLLRVARVYCNQALASGYSSGLLRVARGGYCNQAFASGYSSSLLGFHKVA